MKATALLLCFLTLIILSACDSGPEGPDTVYTLILGGTEGNRATCTITLENENGASTATFSGLSIPNDADLGLTFRAEATCTKEEEIGELNMILLLDGLIADTASTKAPFGSATVKHP